VQAAADLATAQQNLANVTSRVDATEEEVAAAQAAVETAQAAANKAKEDAEAAQSTADTAKANADKAQADADNAKTAANNAQQAATEAKAAADKAQADVDSLEVRVTTAETSITQNAEEIELRATKTEVIESSDEVRQAIIDESASITTACSEIIFSALEKYVETSDFDEFQQTTMAALSVMNGEIVSNLEKTTTEYTNVNGELQEFITNFSRYIKFASETAITIGSGDSTITLEIDNEKGIIFKKNGEPFGRWDGVDFHTGNIVVEVNKRAQFGNFAYVPRSDGSLMFVKVGG